MGDILEMRNLLVLGDEKRLGNGEDVPVDERLLDVEVHVRGPDLLENVVVEVEQDLNKQVERLLLVSRVLDGVIIGEQTRLGLEQSTEQCA